MKQKVKTVKVPRGIVDMYFNIAVEEATQKGLRFKKNINDPVIQKIMHKHLVNWYAESIVPNVRNPRKNPSTPKVAGVPDKFDNLLSVQGELGKIVQSLGSNNPAQYTTALKGSVNHLNNIYMELVLGLSKDDVERSAKFDLRRGDKVALSGKVFQNRMYRAVITASLLALIENLYSTKASDFKKEIQRLFPEQDPTQFASSNRRREFLEKFIEKYRRKLESVDVVKTLGDINETTLPKGSVEQ